MVTKKKPTLRKSTTPKKGKKQLDQNYQTFKLCKESENFVTFRFTKQTLYWIVLLVYILLLSVWISNAQMSAMTVLL